MSETNVANFGARKLRRRKRSIQGGFDVTDSRFCALKGVTDVDRNQKIAEAFPLSRMPSKTSVSAREKKCAPALSGLGSFEQE
jgi:hypothetical protein